MIFCRFTLTKRENRIRLPGKSIILQAGTLKRRSLCRERRYGQPLYQRIPLPRENRWQVSGNLCMTALVSISILLIGHFDGTVNMKAHVHCVIVGFSIAPNPAKRRIYVDGRFKEANNINAYLLDAPDEFFCNRSKPLWSVPQMTTGNRPADGGNLIIEKEDYEEFIRKEPQSKPYIKNLVGSAEFINDKERWCLWLVGITPAELRKMPLALNRVEACKRDRENSPDAGRRKLTETPTLFREINNPASFILVPQVSSERRRYVPMGFLDCNTISTNLNFIIPEATMYQFAILTSNIHMAWMRTAYGRLEMRYRYSANIVYNNFPWRSRAISNGKRSNRPHRQSLMPEHYIRTVALQTCMTN